MEIEGRVVAVTGGASGIGRALCQRFASEGAAGVAVADLDGDGAAAVAASLERTGTRTIATRTDVGTEADVAALVERAERELGPIDLFCSNAGIAISGGPEVPDDAWERIWAVNVMAHVHAARVLVPLMAARGGGYLLSTASAAGLLTNLGSAPYSVTKHAAVAFAEWLSITYGNQGLQVACVCPMGVDTAMLNDGLESADAAQQRSARIVASAGSVLPPLAVAEATLAALRERRFLVLPHPEVETFVRRRADDHDRWLAGMRRLAQQTT